MAFKTGGRFSIQPANHIVMLGEIRGEQWSEVKQAEQEPREGSLFSARAPR